MRLKQIVQRSFKKFQVGLALGAAQRYFYNKIYLLKECDVREFVCLPTPLKRLILIAEVLRDDSP